MVTIVKHEWHQVDAQFAYELDAEKLSEIYPDHDEEAIQGILEGLEDGSIDIEDVVNEAWNNDIEIEWDRQYDDWWTDRKGGYDITYELGDEDSWHTQPTPPEPTHKCTKCKWTGQSYDADWQWPEDDETGEQEAKKVCPYCESDTELTEAGIKDEEERKERMARWQTDDTDETDSDDEISDEEAEEAIQSLEDALEELRKEFDTLIVAKPEATSTHWPTPDSNFVETAKWPFENNEDESSLKESYPEDTYTIRIWGRTREIGVSKIKKAQYDYWSDEDHEDDLSDALNENYDYDENDTPEKARFELPYYEYQDKISFYGFDQDDTHMTIENSEGETIYEGDLESFISEAHGDDESIYDATEEVDELYPHYLGKGYWLYWTQGGKGSCIQTSIEGVFEPKKLKVLNWDIEGTSVVTRLVYDGTELDDEGMDSEHDNWRGQWSTFSVHHNKK